LVNWKKLNWLYTIKDQYYFYTTIFAVLFILSIIEFIRFVQPNELTSKILILFLFFVLSVIGFFYKVGVLMKVQGDIDNKILCITHFISIFGFVFIFVFLLVSFLIL